MKKCYASQSGVAIWENLWERNWLTEFDCVYLWGQEVLSLNMTLNLRKFMSPSPVNTKISAAKVNHRHMTHCKCIIFISGAGTR